MDQIVPRTATQKNVNNVVYKSLKGHLRRNIKIIDVPCGDGVFADYIKCHYPDIGILGADILHPKREISFDFQQGEILTFLKTQPHNAYDIALCISGIMCFDSITDVIGNFHRVLKPGGMLVITNDNITTVRDRLEFLFFGRLKRFRLLFEKNENIWNLVLIQTLHMLLKKHSFSEFKVKFTSIYIEDVFFIPIAILLYPLLIIRLALWKGELPFVERLRILPFMSLIGRHYVITAIK